MEGFSLGAKLRQGASIGLFYIYAEQIKMLASDACFAVCSLLGTTDVQQ